RQRFRLWQGSWFKERSRHRWFSWGSCLRKEHNVGIEDKDYDRIMQLITTGPKEKGALLDEEAELSPEAAPDEFDDLLSTFGSGGMEVVEGPAKLDDSFLR